MPKAAHKALVQRFYDEVWTKGNVRFAREFFAARYLRHDLASSRALDGPAELERQVSEFRSAFPDLRFEVDILLREGQLVAARWTASGVHLGSWGYVEPTGLRVTFSGVDIFRFERGRVAEVWNHRDDLGLLEQAGPPVYVSARPDI